MPAKRAATPVINPNDRYLIAATIYAEARGEGARAMRAVGDVILNRLFAQHEGAKTVAQVVLGRGQFSCWPDQGRNPDAGLRKAHLDALDPTTKDGKAWAEAQKIAEHALNVYHNGWARLVEVGNAVYFAENRITPLTGWEKVKRIGKLTFYRQKTIDAPQS